MKVTPSSSRSKAADLPMATLLRAFPLLQEFSPRSPLQISLRRLANRRYAKPKQMGRCTRNAVPAGDPVKLQSGWAGNTRCGRIATQGTRRWH